jgi:hypothetical protein
MTDPFSHHPKTKILQEKKSSILTLEQANNLIDRKISEIELCPPQIWGFTRDDFVERLEELKEELKKNAKPTSS